MTRKFSVAVALCAVAFAGTPVLAPADAAAPPVGEPRMFFKWGERVGGPSLADTAADVSVFKGSTYLAGTQRGTGLGTVVVVKYDDDGKRVWKRVAKTDTDDTATGSSAGAYGTVVLADTGEGFWVRRYSAKGKLLWSRSSSAFEGLGPATGLAIEVIRRTVLVVGAADGANDNGGDARLIARIALKDGAPDGLTLDTTGADSAWTEAVRIGTDLAVVGRVGDPAEGDTRLMVRRVNPLTLVRRWSRSINTSGHDVPGGIAAYGNRLYVSGSVGGQLANGKAVKGASDFFLRAYRGGGRPVWSQTIGSQGADPAAAVAATPDGAILVGSQTSGDDPAGSGSSQVRIYRYEKKQPKLKETRVLGGKAFDGVNGVDWNFYGLKVAGSTRSRLFGKATGSLDMFVAKYAVVVKRK